MKSERQSRGLEARAAEKEDKRSKYNMGYVSSTDVPEHIKKEGFDYYWERTSLRGQTDSSLDAALRRGWIPVPIDRDPDRFCDILERNPLSRKFICQGDVILLEREKVMTDQERQTNDKVSMERLTSSPAYNYRDPMKHTIGTVR
jgi:hypothetical protein